MEIENQNIQISIVVPLFNEEESIGELTDWIDRVCAEHNLSYEIIMVDDGSTDKSWNKVEELMVSNNKIKGISFRRNYGKSAALNVAFEAVKGDNAATRRVSGIKLHDMNCGLKAYKKEVVKSIEVYGEMHRYIPVIAKWAGFNNIGEKVVQHQERKYGKTKFGLERFLFGFLDLFSITFLGQLDH